MTTLQTPNSFRFLLKDRQLSNNLLLHPCSLRNRLHLYLSVFNLNRVKNFASIVLALKSVHFMPPLIPSVYLDRILHLFNKSQADSDPLFSSSYGRYQLELSQKNFDNFIEPVLSNYVLPHISHLYYDIGFSFLNCRLFTNFNITPSDYGTYSENWHVDDLRGDIIKLFIPLEDIGLDQGPTHILSSLDTKLSFLHGYRDRISTGKLLDLIEKDIVHPHIATSKKGAFYLFNPSYSLHRASIPAFGKSRSVLQLIMYPSLSSDLSMKSSVSRISPLDRYMVSI